jgi:hypothetical protein
MRLRQQNTVHSLVINQRHVWRTTTLDSLKSGFKEWQIGHVHMKTFAVQQCLPAAHPRSQI